MKCKLCGFENENEEFFYKGLCPNCYIETGIVLQDTPMTKGEVQDLVAWLETACEFENTDKPEKASWRCDNTMALTRTYLERHEMNVEECIKYLGRLGAFCDCEVVFNAERTIEVAEKAK